MGARRLEVYPDESQDGIDGLKDLLEGDCFSCVPVQDVDPVIQERYLSLARRCRHSRSLSAGCSYKVG